MEAVAESETDETMAKGLVVLVATEEDSMTELLLLLLGEGAAEEEAGALQVEEDEEGGGGLQVDEGDGSTQVEVEVGATHSEVEVDGGGVQVEVGGVQVEVGVGVGEGCWSSCPSNHQVMAMTPAPSSANWVKSYLLVNFPGWEVRAYTRGQTACQLWLLLITGGLTLDHRNHK
jgi:hypothetical protein